MKVDKENEVLEKSKVEIEKSKWSNAFALPHNVINSFKASGGRSYGYPIRVKIEIVGY